MPESTIKSTASANKVKDNNETNIFYINDFSNNGVLQRQSIRFPTVPQLGMEAIRAKTVWGRYFVDFATSTTIHGLNHLTAPRRHIFEKYLAVLFIFGAFIALIFLSTVFWKRFQTEPTYIILDHDYKNFNVTPPAVVVCPAVRIEDSKFSSVFEKYGVDDTPEIRDFFKFISNVTYDRFHETPNFTAVSPKYWLQILDSLKPDEYSFKFSSLRLTVDPSPTWIITEAGFCLSFLNYIAPYSTFEYWKKENSTIILPQENDLSYDYEARELAMTIRFDIDITVMITNSGNIATMGSNSFRIPKYSSKTLKLYTAEVSTPTEVKDQLSSTQRNCYFPDENHLKLWPIYTYAMCIEECRYKIIRELCGCHPHFVRPTDGISICNAKQLQCIGRKLDIISTIDKKRRDACRCYADCSTTIYSKHSFNTIELKKGSPPMSVVNILLQYPKAKHVRAIIFGSTDFLASVGGGAGLCLGASVISFIEVFYFLTLRLYWYLYKNNI